jgi:ribosomal protein L37AE/L43A
VLVASITRRIFIGRVQRQWSMEELRLMGKVKQHLLTDRPCIVCDSLYPKDRAALGYSTCMRCGEVLAKQRKHTVAPMHKSNYMLITNLADLRGINNKGGSFR